MKRNRGSFLIICMSLMVLMVVLALAALHEIRLQVQTSTGNERYLLAQAAAQAGLNHAVEDILTDYNQTNMTLRSTSSPPTVLMPAVTYLDGQYRAPFVAIYSPNNPGTDYTPGQVDDDVRTEDNVLAPMSWWWFEYNTWWNTGMYDGKGRYYEPNYYNTTFNASGSTTPVVPTMFADPKAAVPERAAPMLYDEQFCRIPSSGNLQQDRVTARYRLRYSVGVEDLSGHLLIDPIPDMQMLSADAAGNPLTVDYRNPEVRYPWMPNAANAVAVIFALAGAINSTDCTQSPTFLWSPQITSDSPELGTQLQNVFEGRGFQTNVDLTHSVTGLSGTPITFPLMYRNHSVIGGGGPGCWASYIDNSGTGSITTNLYWSSNGLPTGLKGGGEPIQSSSGGDGTNFWPYNSGTINHCLMGPQLSFDNTTYAVAGERAYLAGQDSGLPCGWTKFALTPFGR